MKNLFLLTFVSLLFLTGCGGEGACCTQGALVQSKEVASFSDETNKTPVANISDLPISTQDCRNVTANSDLSYDLDGTIESYIWSVDGVNVTHEKNPDSILPCENSKTEYQVCLTVIDDKGASSNKTCQAVKIVQKSDPTPINRIHIKPSIEIPTPYRDGDYHVFDICEQTFDRHEVVSYHWQVTKHFKDGATATHTNDTCQKRIYAKVKEFESVDVTLSITFTDGDISSATSSYIQSSDAQALND